MAANKSRIRKWVEALRSGKYEQGVMALRREDGLRCCLGVACDIYVKETKKAKWIRLTGDESLESGGWAKYGIRVEGVEKKEMDILPKVVRDWFGITTKAQDAFISMNDEDGASFKEIAEAVEKKYLTK